MSDGGIRGDVTNKSIAPVVLADPIPLNWVTLCMICALYSASRYEHQRNLAEMSAVHSHTESNG
jgi:hypothetical protein